MTKWTKEEFIDAVAKSKSIREVFIRLGNSTTGYNTFHKYRKLYNIDVSHLCGQILAAKGQKGRAHARPLSEILVRDSTYHSGSSLRIRLIREGLLEPKCKICGIDSWNGEPLTLQLDHINGDHWDHRIENLRILCPNCHTQTETYANKKGSNKKPTKKKCQCGCDILYTSSTCIKCRNAKGGKKKIVWPDADLLTQSVKNSNFSFVGKQLGVSDNALRKHLQRLGVDVIGLRPRSKTG